jgi:hypothetical protein
VALLVTGSTEQKLNNSSTTVIEKFSPSTPGVDMAPTVSACIRCSTRGGSRELGLKDGLHCFPRTQGSQCVVGYSLRVDKFIGNVEKCGDSWN